MQTKINLAPDLAQQWMDFHTAVVAAHMDLDETVFTLACRLFLDRYADGQDTPARLTREYDRDEFLLVVDEQGQALLPTPVMLAQYSQLKEQFPDFGRWFTHETLTVGESAGQPVLLAARWLCHQVGLRHMTVELFLDPPHLPGFTLVQVRGVDKVDSPGAFDFPCAGHINGVDGVQHSLAKELSEELNLELDCLEDLHLVATYGPTPGEDPYCSNQELRVLYRAKLKAGSAARIRFSDGEVAGLCMFSVPELRLLVERFPERVGRGLLDSIERYQDD